MTRTLSICFPVLTGAVALRDTTLLAIPRRTIRPVVQSNPQLARMLGETIELRRRAAEDARAAQVPTP